MSDKDTIFGNDQPTSTEEGTTSTGNQITEPVIPELVKDLIGEGNKYKDVEAALNSIPHADNHIQTLEAELADLRSKAGESKTVDDVLKALSNQTNNDATQTGEVNTDQIVDKVVKTITDKASAQEQNNNAQLASDGLVKLAGSKDAAIESLRAKATEMGVGVDDLMRIAAKSPSGFLQLFPKATTNDSNSTSQPSQSTINSLNIHPEEAVQGSFNWWMQQKKERGINWYSSQEASAQRLKDAERLGREVFFQS